MVVQVLFCWTMEGQSSACLPMATFGCPIRAVFSAGWSTYLYQAMQLHFLIDYCFQATRGGCTAWKGGSDNWKEGWIS